MLVKSTWTDLKQKVESDWNHQYNITTDGIIPTSDYISMQAHVYFALLLQRNSERNSWYHLCSLGMSHRLVEG